MQELTQEDKVRLGLLADDVAAALNRAIGWGSREPRWRYFETADGWLFCWNTEPVDLSDGRTQRWRSWIYKPYGRGARTGNADRWKLIRMAGHATRQKSKARAYRLYGERCEELRDRERNKPREPSPPIGRVLTEAYQREQQAQQ